MEKAQILAIGTNREIMGTLKRLIDKNPDWQANILFNTVDALEFCVANRVDMILVGAGISASELEDLKDKLATRNLAIPTVLHYGGGSGLLYPEIYAGLSKKP